MDRVDRRLDLVRAGLVRAAGTARTSAWPSAIRPRSHGARSWSASSTSVAVRASSAPRGATRRSSISASSPAPRARRASARRAARPSRIASAHRSVAHERVARARRVALVEDQVDDRQHRPQPLRQLGLVRHAVRDAARRGSCPSRARAAAPSSARATRNARAISAVVSPPSSRSVSATWALAASAGWQQVKIRRSRSSRTGPSSGRLVARVQQRRLGVAVVARRLAAQPVDRAVAGGGDDPARGARRQPVDGHRSTAAANASWTASSAMSMSPKTRTRTATARPYSSRKTRSISDVGRSGQSRLVLERPHLDRQRRRPGEPAAPTRARRRGRRASMIVKPPRCSLPSANGPSVMSTSPPSSRTTVAVLGGCRPPANTHAPAALSSLVQRVEVAHDLLQHARAAAVAVGLVDAEQVLLHRVPPAASSVGRDDDAGRRRHAVDELERGGAPPSANSRRPEPSTSGWIISMNSSIRLRRISDWTQLAAAEDHEILARLLLESRRRRRRRRPRAASSSPTAAAPPAWSTRRTSRAGSAPR